MRQIVRVFNILILDLSTSSISYCYRLCQLSHVSPCCWNLWVFLPLLFLWCIPFPTGRDPAQNVRSCHPFVESLSCITDQSTCAFSKLLGETRGSEPAFLYLPYQMWSVPGVWQWQFLPVFQLHPGVVLEHQVCSCLRAFALALPCGFNLLPDLSVADSILSFRSQFSYCLFHSFHNYLTIPYHFLYNITVSISMFIFCLLY